ncbi:MAG: transcription termination factor Rho, partial [Actinomycetota bacterium]|nr:transcription termination factor Rho [Actinomycetota bacterium]
MTDTDLITAPATSSDDASSAVSSATRGSSTRARTGLSGMVLTELRALAGELGIKGTSGMRKGDLIAAIKERQAGSGPAPKDDAGQMSLSEAESAPAKGKGRRPKAETSAEGGAEQASAPATAGAENARVGEGDEAGARGRRRARGAAGESGESSGPSAPASADSGEVTTTEADTTRTKGSDTAATKGSEESGDGTDQRNRGRNRNQNGQGRNQNRDGQGGRDNQRGDNQRGDNQRDNRDGQGNQGGQNNRDQRNQRDDDGDGDGGGRGRRGRRFRERRRGRDRDSSGGGEPQVSEDDVLQPVAGILDVLDNYAFVRTSGYLAGPNDVYVSMNMVRKNGLRRGDAITGAVKVPREGEQPNQRQKFNPLVRLDSVNGTDVDTAKKRPEFGKLTPLYPNQRLRLETSPERLDTRVIDLIMPIGKGQRALIVSPPKAGKTTILQDVANAITINNPECHLMVVLVDERPEEVTDMQRSVKGEVIASTFDRPPSDHTSVAELAIERAKRLVENGKDVVVLLDSITRLGRAYNNASPASGRILSGGVDSTALYPPKRFLGAARNIEHGGSLTIIATAMVETGSTGDTVIFEEFKGTGNAELKLDRKIAERRVFPAVDVNPSGTRKDELLLSPEEFQIVHKLRRVLSGL